MKVGLEHSRFLFPSFSEPTAFLICRPIESWIHAKELQRLYVTAVEAAKAPGQNLPMPDSERVNTRGGEM